MGGVHGSHPDLANLENGDLKHQFDDRQIYASILEQWLVGNANAILGEDFTTLPLIDATTSVAGPPAEIPNEFTLKQNYPNPFNPSTTIEYSLPEPADVKLEIVNSRGRRVALLVNERQDKGRHQLSWNANGHGSGTYFYKIKAGSFQETRRMTLVR